MASILLNTHRDTERLGRLLAQLLPEYGWPPIFARGPLGCGKTALASQIVANMQGGGMAEVSSPSFTICNQYPTSPAALHCDLYRCKGNVPEEMLEMAEQGAWLYVEWSEYYPPEFLPKEYLDISFIMVKNSRLLDISAAGAKTSALQARLLQKWRKED